MAHWLLRIGDGKHFISSSSKGIWGITSSVTCIKGFLSRVKEGDFLWFVKSGGQIIAVATFEYTQKRELGPLIQLTPSNEELGWIKTSGMWDTQVHFKNLYNLNKCEFYSEIKGPLTIRLYNDKCKVNLPKEYINIVRYSNITNSM
jgi:hypothetical protein